MVHRLLHTAQYIEPGVNRVSFQRTLQKNIRLMLLRSRLSSCSNLVYRLDYTSHCTRGNKARMTLVCDRDQGCMGYRKKLNEEELAQRPVHSNLQNQQLCIKGPTVAILKHLNRLINSSCNPTLKPMPSKRFQSNRMLARDFIGTYSANNYSTKKKAVSVFRSGLSLM